MGQTGFFSHGEVTSLGERKLWIQTCKTPLKNWLCVITCQVEELVNMDTFFTIKLYLHLNCLLMINWIIWNWTVFDFETVIIIIMSCRKHGYPWPSLATSPDRSSPLVGLQGYISYPHISAVCSSWSSCFCPAICSGSLGVHHLWARPCFSRSVQQCPSYLVWNCT